MNVGAVVQDTDLDVARKAKKLYAKIRWYQDMFRWAQVILTYIQVCFNLYKNVLSLVQLDEKRFSSCLETCPKPVIAAIHNACVGGGVDLITAADIR